jgi:Flp pilus assembly protein protease CpaA
MFDFIIIIIALIWLTIASITDVRTTEVPNWLSFSLIVIALGIFSFISIIEKSFTPILSSLTGLVIFTAIGAGMYYSKQWGGADAKILMGLGALLHQYPEKIATIFSPNLNMPFLMIIFINIFLAGAIYGLLISIVLMIKERKQFTKSLKEIYKKTKRILIILTLLTIMFITTALFFTQSTEIKIMLYFAGIFPLIFFNLFIAIKAIEKISMEKIIDVKNLIEGDWIDEDIKVGDKLIYSKKSLGVNKKQIILIQKHREKVKIKAGIAFLPPFLIGTIISIIFGNIVF